MLSNLLIIGYVNQLLCSGIALYALFRGAPSELRRYLQFSAAFILIQITGDITALYGIKNLVYHHFFAYSIFLFNAILYFNILNIPNLKKASQAISIACVALFVLNLFFWESIFANPTIAYFIVNTSIILNCLLFFYQIFLQEKVFFLERYPLFWINSANLIIYAGNMVLFLVDSVIVDNPELYSLGNFFYNITQIIYIVPTLMLSLAFWQLAGKKTISELTPSSKDEY